MKESKEDEFGIVGMFRSIQNAEGGGGGCYNVQNIFTLKKVNLHWRNIFNLNQIFCRHETG